VALKSKAALLDDGDGDLSPLLDDGDDDLSPLLDDGDDDLAQPLDDNESALSLSLEPAIHNPEPAMQEPDDNESAVVVAVAPEIPHPEPAVQELAVGAVLPPSRRGPRRHVTFGNVQVREYSATLGDHPCADGTGGYPISLDWAHAEAEEYSLDWYEETKPNRIVLLTAEARKFVIQDISGMDRSALEALEEQRLQTIERERIEQQQRRQARSEARKAARALLPVRRSARLSSKAPPQVAGAADAAPPTLPLRRSSRLANKALCSYRE
jgi:hypothetical protein